MFSSDRVMAVKVNFKISELCGVEICLFPSTRLIAYTTACCYRTTRDTRGVVGDFVLNFGRHGNGAGRGVIWLTSFNSPPMNTPFQTQAVPRYSLYKRSDSLFCLKFRCHGNGVGLVGVEFVWHHSIDPLLGASGTAIFSTWAEL